MRGSLALVLAGCGRIGFGEQGTPDDTAGDAVDAPDVPRVVCRVVQHPVTLAGDLDLAVAPTAEGYLVAGTLTAGGQIGAQKLDDQLALGTAAVPGPSARIIGGLADAGSRFVALVREDNDEVLYSITRDLASWEEVQRTPNAVVGRDPFPTDTTRIPRVWLNRRTPDNSLEMTYVSSTGTLGLTNVFQTGNKITSITGDDGPDHGHAVWTEELTGTAMSRCTASDIRFLQPPAMGSMQVISDDCHEIRNASGPPAADSMIIVWSTTPGSVEARYIASTGDLPRVITPAGHAPRARFDGTRFWLAWLDNRTSPDELHVAMFDLAGLVTDFALPGWHPAGNEAFELVARGTTVHLVLFDGNELVFMELCS